MTFKTVFHTGNEWHAQQLVFNIRTWILDVIEADEIKSLLGGLFLQSGLCLATCWP